MSTTPSRTPWPLPLTARRERSSRPATSRSTTPRWPAAVTDLTTISEYGRKGVLALLAIPPTQSARALPPRADRGRRCPQPVRPCRNKRIIVATFASNIYRVQQIIDLAIEDGRKVACQWRSMVSNTEPWRGAGLSARAG